MDFLNVTKEQIEEVRKIFNLNETEIKEMIEIIKTWLTKRPHLPQDISDDLIEHFLLRNKFQVERTKEKIDSYFTMRGSSRGEFIQQFETFVPSNETTTYLPMIKLSPKLERVIVWKLNNEDPEHFDYYRALRFQMAVDELCLKYDYPLGTRYILDTKGLSLKHLLKLNPILFTKALAMEEKAYSNRIKGFDVLNFPSSFGSKLMALFKAVMKPKIYDRVKIHKDLDSLHEVVPKECLPNEYGGTAGDIPDLLKEMDEILKNHHDFFIKNYENVSREELRPVETDDAYGVQGTFKKLTID